MFPSCPRARWFLYPSHGVRAAIVASQIPAIEEVVEEGKNALLVEPASVAPLASAITDLLADREKSRAFGRRSREIFEERFTLDRCTERMVQFIVVSLGTTIH